MRQLGVIKQDKTIENDFINENCGNEEITAVENYS